MKVYQFEKTQLISASIDQCWEYFSTPKNLKNITPPKMGFEIIGSVPSKMYAGQIIQYYVKPLLGIKLLWVTEITQVDDKKYFIDQQRFGPYKMWHHQHIFKETENGIEMKDIIHYVVPFGFLGRIAHWLFISKDIRHIFEFRKNKINTLFNAKG
jgi:ligand-binding SRPBCC domain-containing protein